MTKIEWTHPLGYKGESWNPTTGCAKLSAGCDHCYAEGIAERFRGTKAFPHGFDLTLHPERLDKPKHWRKPRCIFVNSMSDQFHEGIPTEYIGQVFDVMEEVDQHIYQVLTKRSSLIRNFVNARYPNRSVPAHIWLGVSIENASALGRLRHLQQTNASVRFLSLEPLLGPLDELNLEGIHWVIVGGESGPGARPMKLEWARSIVRQCHEARVAVFVKQLGMRPYEGETPWPVHNRKGGDMAEWPDDLRIREFPDHDI